MPIVVGGGAAHARGGIGKGRAYEEAFVLLSAAPSPSRSQRIAFSCARVLISIRPSPSLS